MYKPTGAMKIPSRNGRRQPHAYSCSSDRRGREHDARQAAEEQRQDLAEALPPGHRRTLLRRRGLEQVGRGGAHFATAGEPLDQPRHDEDDGRRDPDLRVSRRQPHQPRADRHEHQRQRHRRAPAGAVRIGADDRRTQRAREEADAERGQRAQQPSGLRIAGEERAADHDREEGEGEKVVELEPVADDDGHDGLARQDVGGRRGRHG